MKSSRRQFLGDSAKILAGGLVGSSLLARSASAAGPASAPATEPAKGSPIPKRTLGRTGLKVTVITLGTINTDENVVRYALDEGINYMHTSLGYLRGRAIEELGKGIAGKRDKVYLGLKVTWPPDQDAQLDRCLKILKTDYVDVLFFNIHANPESVESPALREGFERWKKQGKARFCGLTTHGTEKPCMEAALRAGWYDCLMPKYRLDDRASYKAILDECEKKKIGMLAMKTNLRPGDAASLAAFLQDPGCTTVTRTMKTLQEAKEFIDMARAKPTQAEIDQAIRTAELAAIGRCGLCGTCSAACPNHLATADLVRCVDYYVDTLGAPDVARETYEALDPSCRPDRCADCGRCEQACPKGVPVRHFIKRARELFA